MYDSHENHPNARTRAESHNEIKLDADRHTVSVNVKDWRHMQKLVIRGDISQLKVNLLHSTVMPNCSFDYTSKYIKL